MAILFLLLAMTSTEAGQLVKLPFLFSHFLTHKMEKNVSFIDFLAEHYGNHHDDEDMEDDRRLPFQVVNAEHFSIICLPVHLHLINRLSANNESNYFENLSPQVPSCFLKDIFHPPKDVSCFT